LEIALRVSSTAFIRISGSVQVSIYLASVNEVLMQSFGARISFIVETNK
jgi:hypothetical protein